MLRYEYKVVPAPAKAIKVKGLKGTEQRFAAALAAVMNELGADGWEYQRADTLPCEERQGLTGKTTTFQNMLVFRRPIEEPSETDAILAVHATAPPAVTPKAAPVPRFSHQEAQPEQPVPAATRPAAEPALAARPSEGTAPRLGAARHPEPSNKTNAPDLTTH